MEKSEPPYKRGCEEKGIAWPRGLVVPVLAAIANQPTSSCPCTWNLDTADASCSDGNA
jgi:hypothetical protein